MNYLSVLTLVFLFFHGYAHAFDYWMISQFWPRGHCHGNGLCVRTKPKPLQFTIHGLWPSNYSPKGPSFCTKENFNISLITNNLVAHLHQVWPSYYHKNDEYFWSGEWKRHGRCSNLQQIDFFTLTSDIYARNNLKDILKNAGIVHGKTYNINIITSAIRTSLGGEPQLICKFTASILTEIRICLDKSRIPQYINCVPPSPQVACTNSIHFI
ncbi:hypothetical protein VNO80_13680 [Phaseolus coccineus]|uniref:Uncharacterized protein n=1 Tax=Phaseolus coccineus TaxID=3886 RepID=A0AAN9N251_PHACN